MIHGAAIDCEYTDGKFDATNVLGTEVLCSKMRNAKQFGNWWQRRIAQQ
jgi:hypothetical protein